jgi:hypothetical protein
MCDVTEKYEGAQELSPLLLGFEQYQPAPVDLMLFGRRAGEIISKAAASGRRRANKRAAAASRRQSRSLRGEPHRDETIA